MTSQSPRPLWSDDTKRIVIVIILITAVVLVVLARSMLSLVILAAILAYIFQPLVGWLERRRVPRAVGALVSLILLLLLVSIAPIIVIPALINGVLDILAAVGQIPAILEEEIPAFLARYPTIRFIGLEVGLMDTILLLQRSFLEAAGQVQVPSLTELASYLVQGIQTAGGVLGTAANILSGLIATVVTGALAVVLLVMYTFFLTRDGPITRRWLESAVLPQYWPEMNLLLERLHFTWRNFFRGQILLSLIIGAVTTLAATALGLPAAFVLGLLAGVLEIVPNLGPALAAIPAVLLALIDGSSIWPVNNLIFALIVIGVYVLIQQVENNFLVPRIMSQSLNLHPLVVLVGVVVGTSVAGILGAFLAAPVLASLKVLMEYARAKLTDQDPFPQASVPEQVEAPADAPPALADGEPATAIAPPPAEEDA